MIRTIQAETKLAITSMEEGVEGTRRGAEESAKLEDALQITAVVQQTAQGAHESATAAAQLSRMANDLQQLVQKFRL